MSSYYFRDSTQNEEVDQMNPQHPIYTMEQTDLSWNGNTRFI